MKRWICVAALLLAALGSYCWGFFGHKKINEYAVYLLPPEMLVLYRPRIEYLREHAVDADKRRYILKAEAPRHFIDLDRYGEYPYAGLPRDWEAAKEKFGEDSLQAHGILPWRIQQVMGALTQAFRKREYANILKLSADLGHYIGDAHVPLHTSSNHNGQKTNQHGIHAFWESRVPELLADGEWDFFLQRARYIEKPADRTWKIILESAAAVDSVLAMEAKASSATRPEQKFAYERRNNLLVRQYASGFTRHYDRLLQGMVERRMRQSVQAVADFWYTAWINAGQPDLRAWKTGNWLNQDRQLDSLEYLWRSLPPRGRSCD